MPDQFTLADVDSDGAIQEMAAATAGDTRLDFLRKGALGTGAFVSGGAILRGRVENHQCRVQSQDGFDIRPNAIADGRDGFRLIWELVPLAATDERRLGAHREDDFGGGGIERDHARRV